MERTELQNIQIVNLNTGNFNEDSLDCFILKQRVSNCWRNIDGKYKLIPISYTEDWNLFERKNMAKKIITALNSGATAIAAVIDKSVIGFALLSDLLFGSSKQYVNLKEFYVSEPYRRNGIGKLLFDKING